MTNSFHKTMLRCVVATLALTPTQLWAQASDADSKLILDEIIVTATKREEALQSIPLSVTALTGDQLSQGGVLDATRLKLLTPGLNYGQTGVNAHVAIRGARTEGVLGNIQPIISFYSDGIYRAGTLQSTGPMIDVERVEVLRGPQGTLFGRNSYGGAINVLSKRPEQKFDLGVAVTAGDYSRQDYEGFVNFALSDTVSARLVASHREHDGYVVNTANAAEDILDQDDNYFRGLLLFEPNDRVSLLVRGEYWEQGGNGSGDFNYFSPGSPEFGGVFDNLLPLNVLGGTAPGTPNFAATGPICQFDPYQICADADFFLDAEQKTFSVQLDWEFDFTHMTVLAARTDYENYHNSDPDMGFRAIQREAQYDKLETTQVEVHFADNGEGTVRWLVGAFYLQEENLDSFYFDFLPDSGFPFFAPNRRNFEIDAWAAFGQVTIPLMDDRLRLTGGVRYSDEEQDYRLRTFFDCGGNGPADYRTVTFTPDKPFFTDERRSATFDPVTWHFAVDFDLTDDSMVYGSVSTGYASGGFNPAANLLTGELSFPEQEVTAFELGAKNTFLDGAMTLNLALFYNDFEQMLSEPVALVNFAVIVYNDTGGDGDALGVDLELDWIPTENMLLNVRASWLDAEYGNFNTGTGIGLISGNIGLSAFGTGVGGSPCGPVDLVDCLPFVDVSGRRIAYSPEFTLGVSAEYEFALGGGGTLTPAVGFYYSSEYQTADQYYPFALQDSYTQTDFRLTWRSVDEHWSVSGFIQNIEDEEVILRSNIFNFCCSGVSQAAQTYAAPQIVGLTVGYRH